MTTAKDSGQGNFFPSTHWSGVYQAGSSTTEQGRQAMDNLLRRYFPPLKAWLRLRFNTSEDQCDDWLQSFVLNHILEKDLLSAADPEKGKFRYFLLRSLRNFVVSQLRFESRKKRHPGQHLLNLDDIDESNSLDDGNVQDLDFDREWAVHVVEETLKEMEQECTAKNRLDLWEVFQGRFVEPLLRNGKECSYSDLASQLGLESSLQAANLLTTAKRMFQRNLRQVVSEYTALDADVDNEIRDLLDLLSGSL